MRPENNWYVTLFWPVIKIACPLWTASQNLKVSGNCQTPTSIQRVQQQSLFVRFYGNELLLHHHPAGSHRQPCQMFRIIINQTQLPLKQYNSHVNISGTPGPMGCAVCHHYLSSSDTFTLTLPLWVFQSFLSVCVACTFSLLSASVLLFISASVCVCVC